MARSLSVCLLILALRAGSTVTAQVVNNQIDERILLRVNEEPLPSSTAHATVEWRCVDKSLTRKCLVYHNDQWFSFKVDAPGKYFINIAAQQCKTGKGVQLIVIEGNPCEVETYRLLRCIPQIRQEDVFIELDSLMPGVEYLLNVDGFLGDFCQFEINVADRPSGLPMQWKEVLELPRSFQLQDSIVSLTWQLPDSLLTNFGHFLVYRKQPLSKLMRHGFVAGRSNAYGSIQRKYTFTDTLHQVGLYQYQIVGITPDDIPVLVAEENINYNAITHPAQDPQPAVVKIALLYTAPTRLSFVLYNQTESMTLEKWKVEFNPVTDGLYKVDLSKWIQQDHRSFLLLVMDEFTHVATEYYFRWDGSRIIKE